MPGEDAGLFQNLNHTKLSTSFIFWEVVTGVFIFNDDT